MTPNQLSHELNTPLTVIHAGLQLLDRHAKLTLKEKKIISTCLEESKKLAHVVKQVVVEFKIHDAAISACGSHEAV